MTPADENLFHCKARSGREKLVLNKFTDSPYVHVVKYNRQDKKKMVGIIFYNIHEILGGCNYVKYYVKDKRIYFSFTNEKDIHAFKLTFNGSYTVDNQKATESNKLPRKFQLDTDEKLLTFCTKDYALFYDEQLKMYYVENKNTMKTLF